MFYLSKVSKSWKLLLEEQTVQNQYETPAVYLYIHQTTPKLLWKLPISMSNI